MSRPEFGTNATRSSVTFFTLAPKTRQKRCVTDQISRSLIFEKFGVLLGMKTQALLFLLPELGFVVLSLMNPMESWTHKVFKIYTNSFLITLLVFSSGTRWKINLLCWINVRRTNCKSRGNVHILPQQKKAKPQITRVSDADMYAVVENLYHCCPRGPADGCIQGSFSQYYDVCPSTQYGWRVHLCF